MFHPAKIGCILYGDDDDEQVRGEETVRSNSWGK